MDLGPISAIRPLPMVNPARVKPDLARVFEIDLRDGEPDESYSPSHSRASRGLEDEEGDAPQEDSGAGSSGSASALAKQSSDSSGSISFFA